MANENGNKGTNAAEEPKNQEGTTTMAPAPKKFNLIGAAKTAAKVIGGIGLVGLGWILKGLLGGGSDDDDEPTVSTETTEG